MCIRCLFSLFVIVSSSLSPPEVIDTPPKGKGSSTWHVGRLHAQPRTPREHFRPFALKIAETITLPEGCCFIKTQYKKEAAGVWATYASYDYLFRLFRDREINYAKLWCRDQPVKPYAWFRYSGAEKQYYRNHLKNAVVHLRGISDVFNGDFDILEKKACPGVEEAFDYDEYLLIWNNKRHFASTAALLQFSQQVQLHNALHQHGGFAGEPAYTPRAALPFPGSVDRCMLDSFGDDLPSAYPGWEPMCLEFAEDLEGFKRCFVTAINPESVEIPVAGVDRRDQNYVSVESLQQEGFAERILGIARSHHPSYRIDRVLRQGAKFLISFVIDEPDFVGFRCPHGKHHEKGYLQAVYETSGVATFRCMNTGEDCDDWAVGMTSKAEAWRRWTMTFCCIVQMCCNRPDFPVSEEQCNIYGMRELKAFYNRRCPEFDFDKDFGFHPSGDPRQKAVGWNYEFVEALLEKGGLNLVIDYLNLFIAVLPNNKLLIRTLGCFYRMEGLHFLKDAICAPLTYTFVPENGKKKEMPILKEWLKSPRHAAFTSSFPGRLDIWNFESWSENVNALTLPAVDKNRARAALHQTNLNDVNFIRYMREAALTFWVLDESPLQQEKTRDLLDAWVGRVLFKIAEPIHVMCILDSKEGGTGKSTLGDFLQKALQPQNVHSTNMYEFLREAFNAELHDRLLIRFDDVAKETLSEKKFEQLTAFMKQRITEDFVTTKAKYGSNSTTRKVISNYFGCTNGGDIPGINPDGTERRVLICPVGELEQQSLWLKNNPFDCSDPACAQQPGGCKHKITSARQFWALFRNLCIEQYFDVFVGLWLEAFELREDNDVPMHLLLQETKLVQQQKEKRTEPVIKWWRDCVNLGRLYDSQDRRELQKITLVLPTHTDPKNEKTAIDPNDYSNKWIPVMAAASLYKLFLRAHPASKMTLEEFERSFGLMMERICNFPVRKQAKCYLWTYQQTEFGDADGWKWKRTSGEAANYFVYTLPKKCLKPKATGVSEKEQMEVRDSILKWSVSSHSLMALATSAVDLNRTRTEMSSSSVSFSQYSVDEEGAPSPEPADGEAIPMGFDDDDDAQDGMNLDSYEEDSFIVMSEEEGNAPKKRRAKPVADNSPTKQHKISDKGKEEEDDLLLFEEDE